MFTTIAEFIADIRTRQAGNGIGTAASHVKAMAACLTGSGLCPTNIFKSVGATAEMWAKELAEAESLPVFDNPFDELMEKSLRDGADITSGAICEYDCILSSKSKDRDRDILEQKGGFNLDLKMPLLWQHIQLSPIGKLVKMLDQDENTTKCRYAIADTELGRDAAVLVKFGALRKSPGFRPSEFSPLEIVKDASGASRVNGWHIKKADCFEGSLVSIPANADANILATYAKNFDGLATAFSRNLLKNDFVKHWAKSVYDLRPAQGTGFDLGTPAGTKEACGCGNKTKAKSPEQAIPLESGMDLTTAEKCPTCGAEMMESGKCSGCDYVKPKTGKPSGPPAKSANDPIFGKIAELFGKDLTAPLTNKMYGAQPYPAGSFDLIQWQLRNAASEYLRTKGVPFAADGYTDLLCTMPGSAVVCLNPYSSRGKSACYQIEWSAKDGKAEFTGEPAEVSIEPQIIAKALASHPTSDPARVMHDAVLAEHPAKLAKALIGKSLIDAEAEAAVREVARVVAIHDAKPGIESLFE